MRTFLGLIAILMSSATAADANTDATGASANSPAPRGELQVEIHSPPVDLETTSGGLTFAVQGAASTTGGVRYIDMMLVLDTSGSLRRTDPDDYRTTAAVGLIERLSPKSDIQIGVIGFNAQNDLLQPLTDDRADVIRALKDLKNSGGTNLAAGILTAIEELEKNGREDSSRVIVLFTDGMSNQKKARLAAEEAKMKGIPVQALLLGENLKGGFLLEEIAQTTNGGFVWVLDPTKLPEAFLNLKTTGVDTVTLSVNGSAPVPAELTAGAFSGTVPLEVGANQIVALATSLDGQIRESTITVNVADASCAALEVSALKNGREAISLNERAVQIMVDTSRSMWGQIDGVAKMEIAREILHDAADNLPEDLPLALRAYGNTSPSEEGNCADSSLLVPFGSASRAVPAGTANRAPIHEAIAALRPKGQTPIAFALQQSAADFGAMQSERTLVLVTDGIESCGGDPVAAARELKDQGITIHVIGFDLAGAKDEDTASLRAIAHAADGQFFTANSADELRHALEVTVGTRYRVLGDHAVVASGVLGSRQPMYLPTGEYRIEFDSVPPHEIALELEAREQLHVVMKREAGAIAHTEYRDLLEPTSCEDAIARTRGQRLAQDGALEAAAVERQRRPGEF